MPEAPHHHDVLTLAIRWQQPLQRAARWLLIGLDLRPPSRYQEVTSSHWQHESPAQHTSEDCMPPSNPGAGAAAYTNRTCTTCAVSELFALDVRSSRWIATISARARRLSRPKICSADLGMVRTSRMVHGVASCTVRMEHQVAPGRAVKGKTACSHRGTDLLAGEGTGRGLLRSSRLIRRCSASPGPVGRSTHHRRSILVREHTWSGFRHFLLQCQRPRNVSFHLQVGSS